MKTVKPVVTIVVPLYNEEANLAALVRAINSVTEKLTDYRWQLLFVDDGSRDKSVATLQKLQKTHKNIEIIELARNFGKEAATSAGLHEAKGDAVIVMDADLQHPPKLIAQFVKQWQKGYDIVAGRQKPSASYANLPKRVTARWFYKFINAIGHTELAAHSTDFRLLDRIVVDEFKRLTEHQRLTRGLIDWLGFKTYTIEFTPDPRLNGERRYSYRQLAKTATGAIVAASFVPLRLAGWLGGFIVLISLPMMAVIGYNRAFQHNSLKFTGSATLAALMLFLIGIVLICQGLMSLYIASIHAEVQNRPLYIIRRKRP